MKVIEAIQQLNFFNKEKQVYINVPILLKDGTVIFQLYPLECLYIDKDKVVLETGIKANESKNFK